MTIQVWHDGDYDRGFVPAWIIYRHFKKFKPLEKVKYSISNSNTGLPKYELDDTIYIVGELKQHVPQKALQIKALPEHNLAIVTWHYFFKDNVPLLLRYYAKYPTLSHATLVRRYIDMHPVTFSAWDNLYALFETDIGRVIDRAEAIQQYILYIEGITK